MFELSGGRGSRFFVPQPIRAEIKDHRMEATVKPAAKRVQVTLLRPSGGDAIPTIELFLEDFADATPQDLESLVFALAFRQQVDCWLLPQVCQGQMRTGRVHLMQPVEERLGRHDNHGGSINEFHGLQGDYAAR